MDQLLKQRETWLAGQAKLEAWHAQTREEALEPDLEIVDCHHHLWDYRQLMGYNLLGIFKQQYYLADELVNDIVGAGHNVTRTVYVEAHAFHGKDGPDPETTAKLAPLGEIFFAQGVAAQFASGQYGANVRACAAIVGTADLQAYGAGIEPLLEECVRRCPNFRGVRCSAAHDEKPDVENFAKAPGLYADAKFREGFAVLARLGLTFDAWVYAHQLGDVRDLALAFPNATIVLDHAGTPARLFRRGSERR
jgi:predicted TIM-barrel fold metal-dependent hydrolase